MVSIVPANTQPRSVAETVAVSPPPFPTKPPADRFPVMSAVTAQFSIRLGPPSLKPLVRPPAWLPPTTVPAILRLRTVAPASEENGAVPSIVAVWPPPSKTPAYPTNVGPPIRVEAETSASSRTWTPLAQ